MALAQRGKQANIAERCQTNLIKAPRDGHMLTNNRADEEGTKRREPDRPYNKYHPDGDHLRDRQRRDVKTALSRNSSRRRVLGVESAGRLAVGRAETWKTRSGGGGLHR